MPYIMVVLGDAPVTPGLWNLNTHSTVQSVTVSA